MKYVICHHGIKGQKWGVRNGPPYPLDYEQHNSREKKSNAKSSLDNYTNNNDVKNKARKEKVYKAAKLAKDIQDLSPVNRLGKRVDRGTKKFAYQTWQTKQNIESGRIRQAVKYKKGEDVLKKTDWTRDPIGKDIELEKGRKIYRLITDENEKIKDKPAMYVTTNQDDRDVFKGNFINSLNKNKNQWEKEMELTKNIKVASKESQIDALMKATGTNREEATVLLGKFNYEIVVDEAKRSNESKAFIKEIKNMGYDAVLDLNDSGWMGREPVVMFNADKYLKDNKVRKITDKERWEAIDRMHWNFGKYQGGKS